MELEKRNQDFHGLKETLDMATWKIENPKNGLTRISFGVFNLEFVVFQISRITEYFYKRRIENLI